MRESDAPGMDEGLGIRRDGPGQRPHPAADGTSGGTMWLLRPDGGLGRPDHPLFMGARRVGRERPGAAVIVDLSQVREITADGSAPPRRPPRCRSCRMCGPVRSTAARW
ncbi:hypothetical protein [Streptomyces malaysiensis]|uniref:hypothetical protein n=1 Tax=Streptomyces malaysiensis TaxID=92644 RepID=UPI003711FBBE